MPYASDYTPPRDAAPPARPARRTDGNTRLLIAGGTVALAVYFGWPYLRGAVRDAGEQLHAMGNHSGVEPYDPFGFRQGSHRLPPPRTASPGGAGTGNASTTAGT